MKKSLIIFLCSGLFLVFTGCAANPTEEEVNNNDLVYENTEYNFKLTFPESWGNKFEVKEENEPDKGEAEITVYHAQDGLDNELPTFFTIYVFGSEEDWKKAKEATGGAYPLIKIHEGEDKIFASRPPTGEPPYIEEDEEYLEEYKEMEDSLYEEGLEDIFTRTNN